MQRERNTEIQGGRRNAHLDCRVLRSGCEESAVGTPTHHVHRCDVACERGNKATVPTVPELDLRKRVERSRRGLICVSAKRRRDRRGRDKQTEKKREQENGEQKRTEEKRREKTQTFLSNEAEATNRPSGEKEMWFTCVYTKINVFEWSYK